MFIETKNQSFIDVSNKLKDMGIKNNDFMLKTKNDMLKDVDPYAEDLSDALKTAVEVECKENIWYFLREVVRIPCDGELISFNLKIANLAQIYTDLYHVKTITILPRQCMKTYTELIFALWDAVFNNKDCIVKSKLVHDSNALIKNFHDLKNSLPNYLKYNTTKISRYQEKDKNKYINCNLILDEFAFMKDNKNILIDNSMNVSILTVPSGIIEKGTCGEFAYYLARTAVRFDSRVYDFDPINFKAVKEYVLIQYPVEELLSEQNIEDQKRILSDPDLIAREIYNLWPKPRQMEMKNRSLSRTLEITGGK